MLVSFSLHGGSQNPWLNIPVCICWHCSFLKIVWHKSTVSIALNQFWKSKIFKFRTRCRNSFFLNDSHPYGTFRNCIVCPLLDPLDSISRAYALSLYPYSLRVSHSRPFFLLLMISVNFSWVVVPARYLSIRFAARQWACSWLSSNRLRTSTLITISGQLSGFLQCKFFCVFLYGSVWVFFCPTSLFAAGPNRSSVLLTIEIGAVLALSMP